MLLISWQMREPFEVNMIWKKVLTKNKFPYYYRIKILIAIFLKKYQYLGGDFTILAHPFIPKHLVFLFSNLYGTKGFYKKINETTLDVSFKDKWHNDLNSSFSNANWENYFRICLKAYKDPFHKWFQYRILHHILGTQKLLHKVGISNSPICLACHSEVESLIHLFYYCPKAIKLWKQLESKILISTGFLLNLSPSDILLGYTSYNNNLNVINLIIIVTKIYIYISHFKKIQ